MTEFVWKREFSNKIEELDIPDTWDLCVDMNLVKQNTGLIYSQNTFGSFRCSLCARCWNSSKVYVLFLLNRNRRLRRGTVKMRIFKQGCERCSSPNENPMVTPDNIARVVSNLVHKIQRKVYGVNDQYQDLKPKIYGPLEGSHNKELCEACRYGLCEQQGSTDNLWGPRTIGDHGGPVSSPTLKPHPKKPMKGTSDISWGPLLTPGPQAVPKFSNGKSTPGKQQMLPSQYEKKRKNEESAAPSFLSVIGLAAGALALMYFCK